MLIVEPAVDDNAGVPPGDRLHEEEKTVDGRADHAVDWAALVARVQANHHAAVEELYGIFSRGIRFFLCRQLGPQELDDRVHDTFLIVVQAIQRGELRDPERLMGFVRTIVRRQVAGYIEVAIQTRREQTQLDPSVAVPDNHPSPEEGLISAEKIQLMQEVLASMSTRDREILTRFYLREQSQERICQDMNLTDTQFRLFKSRAKARFGELGRRRLRARPFSQIFMRGISAVPHSV